MAMLGALQNDIIAEVSLVMYSFSALQAHLPDLVYDVLQGLYKAV